MHRNIDLFSNKGLLIVYNHIREYFPGFLILIVDHMNDSTVITVEQFKPEIHCATANIINYFLAAVKACPLCFLHTGTALIFKESKCYKTKLIVVIRQLKPIFCQWHFCRPVLHEGREKQNKAKTTHTPQCFWNLLSVNSRGLILFFWTFSRVLGWHHFMHQGSKDHHFCHFEGSQIVSRLFLPLCKSKQKFVWCRTRLCNPPRLQSFSYR